MTTRKTKRAAKARTAPHALALATLTELLHSGETETARIAAAKALLDRTLPEGTGMTRKQDKDRLAAIKAIKQLLDELAGAKAGGDPGASAVDQNGAAGATDAGGPVENLAGPGGKRVGKNEGG